MAKETGVGDVACGGFQLTYEATMRTLPVAIFTHNRTKIACATVNALMDHLKCGDAEIRYILCDDMSRPGHVETVVREFEKRGITPTVHLNDPKRHGLGASMNRGLEDAFDTAGVCLRMEDDWLLKRDLDVGEWASCMYRESIGAIRLGLMFRGADTMTPIAHGLMKLKPVFPKKHMSFNNQVALVTEQIYEVCRTAYMENVHSDVVEKTMANAYNEATNWCETSPWICWPAGWETMAYYGQNLAFDHIGLSTVGHKCYRIPQKYWGLQEVQNPAKNVLEGNRRTAFRIR